MLRKESEKAARRQATWHGGTKGRYCQGKAHSLQTCRQADIYGLLRGILQRAFGAERCLILQAAPSFLFELNLRQHIQLALPVALRVLHWCPLRQPAHSVAACSPLDADTGSLGSYLQRESTLLKVRCGLLLLWHFSFKSVIRHISLACQHVLVSTDLSMACPAHMDKAKCSQVVLRTFGGLWSELSLLCSCGHSTTLVLVVSDWFQNIDLSTCKQVPPHGCPIAQPSQRGMNFLEAGSTHPDYSTSFPQAERTIWKTTETSRRKPAKFATLLRGCFFTWLRSQERLDE